MEHMGMGVSINGGNPQNEMDGFVRENPMKMDDLGVTPILGNQHIYVWS